MTAKQYNRLVKLLDEADGVAAEHVPLTITGKQIQAAIRELLTKVEAEKIRATERERLAWDS